MADKKKHLTLADFNNLDEYVAYKARLLADAIEKVARKNGVSPQAALNEVFRASVQHARGLRRDRHARFN